jgi:hypothetical protein
MKALKNLSLPCLDEEELASVNGSFRPWLLALAALPFTALVRWSYRDARGTVACGLQGTSSGAFSHAAPGARPSGTFSLGGSLRIERRDYTLDLSGSLQVPLGRPSLASSKVGG